MSKENLEKLFARYEALENERKTVQERLRELSGVMNDVREEAIGFLAEMARFDDSASLSEFTEKFETLCKAVACECTPFVCNFLERNGWQKLTIRSEYYGNDIRECDYWERTYWFAGNVDIRFWQETWDKFSHAKCESEHNDNFYKFLDTLRDKIDYYEEDY